MTYGFQRQDNVDVRVARIFNTYGPRSTYSPNFYRSLSSIYFLLVNPYDGRVVTNFIVQALKGEDLTVYGDGKQTRSFQYVHDLIDGLICLMSSDETRPVNIGNGDEFTMCSALRILDGFSLPLWGRFVRQDLERERGTSSTSRSWLCNWNRFHDYVEHETKMYAALNTPGCPVEERGVLDPNINETSLEMLYGQLAEVLLQLSRPSLPCIGSLD